METTPTTEWAYDPQTREHFLPINDVQSWKVYKTAAGDYALTLHNDDDGHGEDVEYFDTLITAKRTASSRAVVTNAMGV